ncbi:MAG: lysostaphin resistance A-like protein [Bacteroidota bacterium]
MQFKALLADREPYRKFLILVGIALILAVISATLGAFIAQIVTGISIFGSPTALADINNPDVVLALKITQLFSALGTFFVPPLIAAYLFSDNVKDYLGATKKINVQQVILAVILFLFIQPFVNWMSLINAGVKIPEWLQSLLNSPGNSAQKISEALMRSGSILGLLMSVIVISIIPAISEELIFRGVIQKLFIDLAKNKHFGIVLTATLFSAMHMDVAGFIPRFALGTMLGYLYLWSGSIYLPIVAHFTNNLLAFLMEVGKNNHALSFDPDQLGIAPGQEIVLGMSVFFTWVLLFLIRKISVENK